MRIREMRNLKGFSQRELADMLNVKCNTLCQWETGVRHPKANMLVKLSEIFGCTVDELLRDGDERRKDDAERMDT